MEVKRFGEGRYVVRFVDNPAGIAVATSNAESAGTPLNLIALTTVAPGEYRISVFNVVDEKFKDQAFNLLMP